MAPDLSAFIEEIRSVWGTACPELLPANNGGGIWEAEHADKVSWTEFVLPYGVILLDQIQPWSEAPLTGLWYQATPTLFYVASAPNGNLALVMHLNTFINAIFPADPFTTAQRWEMGTPQWSDSLRPNMILSAANHPARAVALPVTFILGG